VHYAKPVVIDYGTLVELTQLTGLFGPEDSANKAVPIHHVPASAPPGP
jgi:hypothetical protein